VPPRATPEKSQISTSRLVNISGERLTPQRATLLVAGHRNHATWVPGPHPAGWGRSAPGADHRHCALPPGPALLASDEQRSVRNDSGRRPRAPAPIAGTFVAPGRSKWPLCDLASVADAAAHWGKADAAARAPASSAARRRRPCRSLCTPCLGQTPSPWAFARWHYRGCDPGKDFPYDFDKFRSDALMRGW
jgi:hypothetical protein